MSSANDRFSLMVDGIEVSNTDNMGKAVALYFVVFYVFNIAFPKAVLKTLVFLQKCAFGINEAINDSYTKKAVTTCLSLISKLDSFHSTKQRRPLPDSESISEPANKRRQPTVSATVSNDMNSAVPAEQQTVSVASADSISTAPTAMEQVPIPTESACPGDILTVAASQSKQKSGKRPSKPRCTSSVQPAVAVNSAAPEVVPAAVRKRQRKPKTVYSA